jgi:4-hydroxy-4-methyl-2-oxoglutarate aldolase
MPERLGMEDERLTGLVPPDRIAAVQVKRPRQEIIEGYKQLGDLTSTVGDVLDKMGLVGVIPASILKPVSPHQRLVGPAVTLRYVPDRILVGFGHAKGARAKLAGHFDAYVIAEMGDVLVVDAGGVRDISCLGGLSVTLARQAGLAGIVVDGSVRDVASTSQAGYPLWARGATPRTGKFRLEVAEINGIIACAGVQVQPRDLILADDDGVVVVPSEHAEEILVSATEATEKEQRVSEALASGASASELRRILSPEKW